MCRHLAWLGEPVTLADLLLAPPYSLERQAWAPRRQRYGTVNADGFGVGWWPADAMDGEPARYRRDVPIWSDASFHSLARVTRARAVLAAVRSATPGLPFGEAAVAPMGAGPWLFSHNGALPGWPESAAALAATLAPVELLRLESRTDSALLWALTRQRLDKGMPLPEALATVVELAAAACGGRLNLLASDGRAVAATTWGDSLSYQVRGSGVLVASEPTDDDSGWVDVPDRVVLTADPTGVTLDTLTGRTSPS